jgi:hypothetical protein
MFYRGFAIKLQNFMERFVAKETNSASWWTQLTTI